MDPIKTWSVVADKLGGHWHVTVRRGVEGSRAKLGELAFDLSDADNFRDQVTAVADMVMVRAISRTLEELGKERLLMPMSQGQLVELSVHVGEVMRAELHELVLTRMAEAFGVRVDLARVNG